jgi:hypothetical protein
MVSGQPCERTAAQLETFIRTALALPTQPVPLILNCSPVQTPCGKSSSKRGSGNGNLESQLGRCRRQNSPPPGSKDFAVRLGWGFLKYYIIPFIMYYKLVL